MSKAVEDSFDAKVFLAKVGAGKSAASYRKGQTIFAQGEVAQEVCYIQKGRIKLVVVSTQGKEAIVGILEAAQFFGEGCLNGHLTHCASLRQLR